MSSHCQKNELKMDMKLLKNNFFGQNLNGLIVRFLFFPVSISGSPLGKQVVVIKPMTLSVWWLPQGQKGSAALWGNIKEQERTEFMNQLW